MGLIHIHFDIANREVIFFFADGVGIALGLSVLGGIPLRIKDLGLLEIFQREPRQKAIHLPVTVDLIKGFQILRGKSAQDQPIGLQRRGVHWDSSSLLYS